MNLWSRRKFFLTSLAGGAVASNPKLFGADPVSPALAPRPAAQGKRPLIISSANGVNALMYTSDIFRGHWPDRILGDIEDVLAKRVRAFHEKDYDSEMRRH